MLEEVGADLRVDREAVDGAVVGDLLREGPRRRAAERKSAGEQHHRRWHDPELRPVSRRPSVRRRRRCTSKERRSRHRSHPPRPRKEAAQDRGEDVEAIVIAELVLRKDRKPRRIVPVLQLADVADVAHRPDLVAEEVARGREDRDDHRDHEEGERQPAEEGAEAERVILSPDARPGEGRGADGRDREGAVDEAWERTPAWSARSPRRPGARARGRVGRDHAAQRSIRERKLREHRVPRQK